MSSNGSISVALWSKKQGDIYKTSAERGCGFTGDTNDLRLRCYLDPLGWEDPCSSSSVLSGQELCDLGIRVSFIKRTSGSGRVCNRGCKRRRHHCERKMLHQVTRMYFVLPRSFGRATCSTFHLKDSLRWFLLIHSGLHSGAAPRSRPSSSTVFKRRTRRGAWTP